MLGPTASGKSEVALRLADEIGADIISVDSMQVYRRMDIGTAKPTKAERARVRHHCIDLVEPSQEFSVADFQAAGRAVLADPARPVMIVGGSGLHFRALVDPMSFRPHDADLRARLEDLSHEAAAARLLELDPNAPDHIDLSNPRRVARALEVEALTGETPTSRAGTEEFRVLSAYRPMFEFRAVGVDPGDELPERISGRLDGMLAAGLLDEVARLAPELGATARQAVGYKELIPVLAGEASLATGAEDVRRASLALAKRQRTFFRRDPRIDWLPWADDAEQRCRMALAALRR